VAATWLQVRVDLLPEGLGGALAEPPGRVFLVGPSHTLAHLAEAIDAALTTTHPPGCWTRPR
jgi:hypothetical protein